MQLMMIEKSEIRINLVDKIDYKLDNKTNKQIK